MWTLTRLCSVASWAIYLLWPHWNLVEGSPVITESTTAASRDHGKITKSTHSSKLRLVLYVGLEGTGHHLITKTFFHLYDNYDFFEAKNCTLVSNILMHQTMFPSAKHYAHSLEKVRAEMRSLARLEQHLEPPGTIVTVQPTGRVQRHCPRHGFGHQLSYPCTGPPGKDFKYPDLQILAEIAEEEGVDFRVLYLQRSALELLISTTRHRSFHR